MFHVAIFRGKQARRKGHRKAMISMSSQKDGGYEPPPVCGRSLFLFSGDSLLRLAVHRLMFNKVTEALLLVILEGYASGLPCIATDVGSCRELIEGSTKEDRAIGPSGSVFSIAEPEAAAAAALRFVQNPDQWHAVQNAAIQRVERYYTEEMMINQYRDVYRTALEAAW